MDEREGFFFDLWKTVREGLTEGWAFRLRLQNQEEQSREDCGKSNLTRRNRGSEAWGGKEFGILEELEGGQGGGERMHIDQVPQVVDDCKDELIW